MDGLLNLEKYLNKIHLKRNLTISLPIPFLLDHRNPASPATMKKQYQCLKVSQQKIINQREKERLSKKAKRHIETEEKCAKRKKTNSDCMSRKRQSETDEQGAKCKKTVHNCMMRIRQTETDEQGAKRKKTDWDYKMRKCHKDKRHRSQNNSGDSSKSRTTTQTISMQLRNAS